MCEAMTRKQKYPKVDMSQEIAKIVRTKKNVVEAFPAKTKVDVSALESSSSHTIGMCFFPDDKYNRVSLRLWSGDQVGVYVGLDEPDISKLINSLVRCKMLLLDHDAVDLEE
jgi:hypothetical protein